MKEAPTSSPTSAPALRVRLGIRAKLFLIALGLITLSVFVAYASARAEIEQDALARIRGDLTVRARLVATRASVAPHAADDLAAWDALADELGEESGGRVTFIDADGRVVGDSLVPLERLGDVENHGLRPEVVDAMGGRDRQSQRFSTTTDRHMIYAAVPVPGARIAVARVGLAQADIETAVRPMRQALIISAGLALTVAMIVASLAVQVASRKAQVLMNAARRMAAGDLDMRTRLVGDDEFAELGSALDQLARSLSKTLKDLSEERDRLSGILESMQEGVLFLDEEGRVALFNPALREMLLLHGDEVGQTLLSAVRSSELKELIDKVQSGEPSTAEINVSGLKPRQLLVRAARMDGNQRGVLAVFVDVTETRRLENIRREFVANVSHELRTPVTSIRSATETLQAAVETRPDMAPRFIEIIDRNAARLHELVEDLLDLSRIESRQFRLSLESIPPAELFEQVVELFSERAERRRVGLVWDVAEGTGLVLGDRRALERVLTNLVDNAVKYAGEGKTVSLRAEQRRDWMALVVSDDGPGIEERHLQRLFERFYRVDAGRSRELGGTGLGLSIVKHLVDSMGGRVRVDSSVGVGTTFTVLLPRRERPSFPPHPEAAS
ncbi:MAG: PAS domain-containing protein [Myxococcales bacterium]|nr:PAS domain-containing protein [Myxococcales bacterium]